jgi:hypothetical protein
VTITDDKYDDKISKLISKKSSIDRKYHKKIQQNNEKNEILSNLPIEQWGVTSSWNLPICLKYGELDSNHENQKKLENMNNLIPMFIDIQTTVILPQIDASIKMMDFGEVAIGSRSLRSVIISNLGYTSVNLISEGECVYVCIYIYICYICVYIYLYMLYMCVYISIYVIYVCIYIYICLYVYMYIYIYLLKVYI